jgi:hypothetical protein
MKYTDIELRDRLLENEDYPNNEKLLNGVIEKIRNFGDEAQAMFDSWWKEAKIPNFDVNGITPAYLRDFHKMKNVGIIIAYDWLHKEPKRAARLLKRPVITKK